MYGKIFEQIYDSSIAEDWQVRVVFQDMIVLADENGVVDRTQESIARRTNVPIEIVRRAITELQKPDPASRSTEENGIRIKLLDEHRDWGWEIVNYPYYRNLASAEQKREKTKLRTRKYREKKEKRIEASQSVTGGHAASLSASASASPFVQGEGAGEGDFSEAGIPTQDEVTVYGKLVGVDPAVSKKFFDYYQGGNLWLNKFGRLIDWRHKLKSWSENEKKMGGSAGAGRVYPKEIKLQMDALQHEIDKHPANPTSIFKVPNPTDLQRASLRQMRQKWNSLNTQLAHGTHA